MSDRKLHLVRAMAQDQGIDPLSIQVSKRKGKRFSIQLPQGGPCLHFGSYPYTGRGTYIDHHDDNLRRAWRARHGKIMKQGRPAYMNPLSPEYWSWHLLW
jgi:hypothetical protein